MLLGELLAERDLQPVLTKVQDQVRREPANPKHRIFLFQLLSILGQWERALTQLNVLEEMDASSLPMVQTYLEALRCEMLRADVFAGRRSPLIFGDPEPWVALLLEALRLTAEGHHEQAMPVREQAFEGAPATSGMIDNQPFSWIADADSRLGPVLEAIVNGRYFWIPFHRIGSVKLEAPADLRDLVWMPALFTWSNGGEAVGLIPARYPGSPTSPDPALQLSHKTEWIEQTEDVYIGMGQRMLVTDEGEYPLLDARLLRLGEVAVEPATSDDAPPAKSAES
ncbi:MAG: virulence protein SciE type [Candidatus Competibacteraceae bacterium]|nr:virulence protein SciE type [Candidatus Competibacteraceae bacterium]MCB1822125.1 virulence protein SciE type [Candidatus Competibacteraceae bacterium]